MTFTKAPDEVLDYAIDWSRQLEADGGDTISTSTWAVTGGSVVIDSQSNTTARSVVWLSGGTAGQTAHAKATVTTAGGRTHQRTIAIEISTR